VAEEAAFTIFLNGDELVTLMATPDHLDELAVGFLRTEGFIGCREDMRSLEVDGQVGIVRVVTAEPSDFARRFFGRRVLSPGCGGALSLPDRVRLLPLGESSRRLRVSCERLLELVDLLRAAPLHRATGATHSAVLPPIAGEEPPVLREDIGRHNAVDKAIGRLTLDGLSAEERVLVTSGRISSDVVRKAAGVGIPVILSRSAPTGLAVELAERLGMTVVGFARGGRLNVYSGEERLIDGG